jgi:glycosyltransferase involved in cell wall biosynthesis
MTQVERRERIVKSTDTLALPQVTVIMPIRNEAGFITHSLRAVLDQDYPSDRLEVIVADGSSSDGTQAMVQAMQAQHSNLRLIDNPGKIVATGLNAALPHARGEIIVRVDGHTVVAANYVRECVAVLRRSGADNVGGRMDAVAESWFGRAAARATSCPFGVGGARFHYAQREEWVDTVYMGAWPREVFQRIGHFDEELVRNQDDEFNYRLRARGGKILLSPRIRSDYYNRSTLRSFARQYFQYGYWKVRVMQKHPGQMRPRHFIPPLLVAAFLLTLVMTPFSVMAWYGLAAVGGFYLVGNFGASALTAWKNDWRLLPLLPLTFFTLHAAWGFGFLVGLIRFANRWRDR